jgi:hypothetical protein
MQLKLETNLPVIFLTLLVIAIVCIGYLELKKLQERLKVLEYHNEESKKMENVDLEVQNIQQEKENFSVQNTPILEQPHQSSKRVEEWQMNNENEKFIKENIIETLNKKDEYIEEIDGEGIEERVVFGDPMFPNQPMMYQMMGDESEQIIEQISRDQELTFDTEENMIDGGNVNHGDEDENDERESDDKESNEDEKDLDVKEEESESGETEGEEIDFKEIPANDDFEKEKIVVDESFSVNELKIICKNLGLQHSGNKTILINRIMDNQ